MKGSAPSADRVIDTHRHAHGIDLNMTTLQSLPLSYMALAEGDGDARGPDSMVDGAEPLR